MELLFIGFTIFTLITLIFSFYIKIFIVDFFPKYRENSYLDNWDNFDISIHYLSYSLHKYIKKTNSSIPLSAIEQWISIWFQARNELIHIEGSNKTDLEALIMNMKSKAIDIGLFKYDTNLIKTKAQPYRYYYPFVL